jgi:hypothetical protein
MNDTERYRAYLLRLWTVEQGGQAVWRASLESAQTGDHLGFPSLDALFDYVRAQTRGESSLFSHGEGNVRNEG